MHSVYQRVLGSILPALALGPGLVEGIVVQGLTKRYREAVALDSVSFSIDGGSILGIVGPNGAGKTTLTRIQR